MFKNYLNLRNVVAIAISLTATAMMFTACEKPDGGDDNPQTVTYSGTAGGQTYTLQITGQTNLAADTPKMRSYSAKAGNTAYTPQEGDSYVLTAAGKTSTGTVISQVGNTFTLTSENAEFTATVSGSGIVNISGSVNWTMPDGSKIIEVVSLTFDTNDDEDEVVGETEYWQNWITMQKAQGCTEGWPSAALQSEYSVSFNNEGEIKLYQHFEIREELYFLKVGSLSNFNDLISQINTDTWRQLLNESGEGLRYIVYESTDEYHTGSITAKYMDSPYSRGIIEIEVSKIDDEE